MTEPKTTTHRESDAFSVGALVIVSNERTRGLARVDRAVGDAHMRLFFYADGTFAVYAKTALAPCPPGFPMQTGDQQPAS